MCTSRFSKTGDALPAVPPICCPHGARLLPAQCPFAARAVPVCCPICCPRGGRCLIYCLCGARSFACAVHRSKRTHDRHNTAIDAHRINTAQQLGIFAQHSIAGNLYLCGTAPLGIFVRHQAQLGISATQLGISAQHNTTGNHCAAALVQGGDLFVLGLVRFGQGSAGTCPNLPKFRACPQLGHPRTGSGRFGQGSAGTCPNLSKFRILPNLPKPARTCPPTTPSL